LREGIFYLTDRQNGFSVYKILQLACHFFTRKIAIFFSKLEKGGKMGYEKVDKYWDSTDKIWPNKAIFS